MPRKCGTDVYGIDRIIINIGKLLENINMVRRKGIGLLELMLALAIISVLLVAATRYFSSADSSRKVNDAANILQAVISAGEDWRMSKNSYEGVTFQSLQEHGLLPQGLSGTSGNPWGGAIEVSPEDQCDNEGLLLLLSKVPSQDCKSLKDLMTKMNMYSSKQEVCPSGGRSIFQACYSSSH